MDDSIVTRRTTGDGQIRETRRPLKGTIKELVRGLRTSIPVSKLVHADKSVREYLLYCAISLVAAMGQPLQVPVGTLVQEKSLEDWLQRGRDLAGATPHRFSLPLDSVLDLLAARINSNTEKEARERRGGARGSASEARPVQVRQ